ncbi:MAG: ABC transporter permease [Treponema sp.]|nr:ABC transporter permease [Treponema sp.]
MSFALPVFIIAVGGIYCERSGIVMLALEGLQGFGAFVGAVAVVFCEQQFGSSPYLPFLAMATAIIGGAFYSMLHGVLCVRFRANQIISGVVVNILAVALTTFLTSVMNLMLTGNGSNKFQFSVSPRFTLPVLSSIPVLGGLFKNMYPFEIVILIIAFLMWYVLNHTKYGLRLRACGDNPHSLDAAGGNVDQVHFSAVMISGALAGLGGICFAYSISASFGPNIYMGYGFLAIAAFIFGNWKILPTFAVCLFFGFARSGGYQLIQALGLTSNFSDLLMIIPYVLTLFLLIFFSKQNHPPRASGEIFDKGKR